MEKKFAEIAVGDRFYFANEKFLKTAPSTVGNAVNTHTRQTVNFDDDAIVEEYTHVY